MKNVLLASLLAIAVAAPMASTTVAQQPAQSAAQQPAAAAGGQIQMSPEEYAAYNNANTQTTPAAKAAAFEAYLKAYPNSAVKADVLNQLLFAYSQTGDETNTLGAADRLLAIDPNNLRALTFEVYYRRTDADKLTDPAAKQAALDKAAAYAQTGLNAPKPKGDMSDADFAKLQAAAEPTFESAIADDDVAKKDFADAITALKTEISANEPMTHAPSPVLQDVFVLAQSYYQSTPPDYLNCAWYATRAAAFAQQFAAQIQPLATYCYKKYHGNADGYANLQALVQTNLNPPPNLSTTVTPAPKPEDIVANLIATTPDLATLAISDKEFVLQYGKPADADKVFDTIKGKSVELPGVTVISATADTLTVAVSDDAVQSKTADFTFSLKTPLTKLPSAGDKVTLDGTYASYTQSPLMITMSDSAVVEKKKPTTVHHPAHHTAQ